MSKDYYKILGVDKKATIGEIKSAYRKMVKHYHPDLHPNDAEAAAKFKEINEAHEVLTDPQRRAAYDNESSRGAGFGGFNGFNGSNGFADMFGDIFSNFGGAAAAQGVKTGADITREISISFMEAAKGCTKEIIYTRNTPCANCGGTGAVSDKAFIMCDRCDGTGQVKVVQDTLFGRTVRVGACPECEGTGKKIVDPCPECNGKGYTSQDTHVVFMIPAGADTNSYIRKKRFGQATTRGGQPGDLIIVIKVLPHKFFKRRDKDLYVELPISYETAVLGGKVKIPGVDGPINYMIAEGTPNGHVIPLKGKGIKTKAGAGNLYVTTVIDIPTKLSRESRKKLQAYAKTLDSKQQTKIRAFEESMEEGNTTDSTVTE